MGRSLVQAKQTRSRAGRSGRIAQATVKTTVRVFGAGLVRRAPRRVRAWRAWATSQSHAASFGRPPCSMDAFALAWRGLADPIAVPTLPVWPRESDATADGVPNRLHGLPSVQQQSTNETRRSFNR